MNVILSLAAQIGVSLVKLEESDLLLVHTSVRQRYLKQIVDKGICHFEEYNIKR